METAVNGRRLGGALSDALPINWRSRMTHTHERFFFKKSARTSVSRVPGKELPVLADWRGERRRCSFSFHQRRIWKLSSIRGPNFGSPSWQSGMQIFTRQCALESSYVSFDSVGPAGLCEFFLKMTSSSSSVVEFQRLQGFSPLRD